MKTGKKKKKDRKGGEGERKSVGIRAGKGRERIILLLIGCLYNFHWHLAGENLLIIGLKIDNANN
jgi:hypothetical protein